jgi:flagellar biosynthesis/type III secretory pathway protein FliH
MICLSNAKVVKRDLQYEVPPEALAALRAVAGEKGVSSVRNEAADAVRTMLDDAAEKAKELVRAASEEAANIVREAAERAEDVRKDAEVSGFEAGYARGAEEGQRAVLAAAEDYMEEMESLAECIRRERLEAVYREEKDLILIAMAAAEKIMRQQCRVDMSAVSKMLTDVIRENEGVIRLYLSEFQHTLELHLDRNITKKLKRFADGLKTVLVKEDDSIMLETDTGVVDASIPSQLSILEETLTEDL